MHMSRDFVKLIVLLWLALTTASGQQLKIQVSLPQTVPGIILGAAFNDKGKEFFVQDFTFDSTTNGQVGRRRISAWNLSKLEMQGNPRVDEYPAASSKYPCGRIVFAPAMNDVIVCSQGTSLEFLDAGSLALKERREMSGLGAIFDFAVDESLDTLLILSVSSDQKIHLISYSLKGQTQKSDLVVGSSYAVSSLSMEVSSSKKLAAIADTVAEKERGILYVCSYDQGLECKTFGGGPPISQISFLAGHLLFASSSFPDDKQACITSVNLSTGARTKAYCAPGTGVHYAVGVLGGKYIVGYTGLRSTNWFTENAKVVESSFAVWKPQNIQPWAKVNDPTKGKGLQAFRVVTSKSLPYFIGFAFSNDFTVYRILE